MGWNHQLEKHVTPTQATYFDNSEFPRFFSTARPEAIVFFFSEKQLRGRAAKSGDWR